MIDKTLHSAVNQACVSAGKGDGGWNARFIKAVAEQGLVMSGVHITENWLQAPAPVQNEPDAWPDPMFLEFRP